MLKKPLALTFTLFLAIAVLVACGNEDADQPTPSPTRDPVTPTQQATTAPTMVEPTTAPMLLTATPETTSTDVIRATPRSDAAPVISDATPVGESATPVSAELTPLTGELVFEGRPQQDYVITNDGCMGLGEWRTLKPGTQVVVKDAAGTVVDVGTLEAVQSDDACTWAFSIDAPAEGFFSVSIPMVTEVWFHADDEGVQAGEINLVVP